MLNAVGVDVDARCRVHPEGGDALHLTDLLQAAHAAQGTETLGTGTLGTETNGSETQGTETKGTEINGTA